MKKLIEYNRPAYLCFIDLKKAFDHVQLRDIIHLLYDRQIPHNLIKTIKNIYTGNPAQAKVNNEYTDQEGL